MGRPSEERSRDEVGPIRSLKSGLAAKGNVGMNEINPMMRSAAIQKLIAERAYELWENQGRPYGCDLIHWHEAEQEIMGCVRRSSFPPQGNAAIQKLIAERAYELWENQGKPHGCDLIHWHEVEQDIIDCVRRSLLSVCPEGSQVI